MVHLVWADLIGLNAIATPAARKPGPLVTLVVHSCFTNACNSNFRAVHFSAAIDRSWLRPEGKWVRR